MGCAFRDRVYGRGLGRMDNLKQREMDNFCHCCEADNKPLYTDKLGVFCEDCMFPEKNKVKPYTENNEHI